MSEHDTSNPRGMNARERTECYKDRGEAAMRTLLDVFTRSAGSSGETMFREGVLAGLRVREEPHGEQSATGEMTRRLHGSAADLLVVRPRWCECDPATGSVCSPRRRPAECDVQIRRELDDDASMMMDLESEQG